MKKLNLILLIFFLMTICCSCRNKESAEPDYTKFANTTNRGTSGEGSRDIEVSPAEERVPDQPSAADGDTEALEDGEGKWPYDLSYSGIEDIHIDKLGNLSANNKYVRKQSGLICPDNNGGFYYVNYGYDNYIYRYKDGVRTLLVDKPANCLQLWDNVLYFLVDNNNADAGHAKTGDIYSYNPDTEGLCLVLQTNAIFLYIDSDGIFFQKMMDLKLMNIRGFRLKFGETIPQETDYVFYISYDNYMIRNWKGNIIICNRDYEEQTVLSPDNSFMNMGFYDDYFAFYDESNLYLLNLTTGDKKIYQVQGVYDFIILNATVYISTGGSNIYTIDLLTDKIDMASGDINFKADGKMQFCNYGILFTDGDKIYTLMNNTSLDTDEKVRLEEVTIQDSRVFTKEIGR